MFFSIGEHITAPPTYFVVRFDIVEGDEREMLARGWKFRMEIQHFFHRSQFVRELQVQYLAVNSQGVKKGRRMASPLGYITSGRRLAPGVCSALCAILAASG